MASPSPYTWAPVNDSLSTTKWITEESPDFSFRIVLVGNSAVGKSSLLLRFADSVWSPDFLATIGVDFKVRMIGVDDYRVKTQIWDTAGQDRFMAIGQAYYRGADGMIVAYDITNRESFEAVEERWAPNIERYASKQPSILLVGTKSDMSAARQVSAAEGSELAERLGWSAFLETSSKSSLNVETAFVKLTRTLIERAKEESRDLVRDKDILDLGGAGIGPAGETPTCACSIL